LKCPPLTPRGYFPEFQLPGDLDPDSTPGQLLRRLFETRYLEIDDAGAPLARAFEEVLDLLESGGDAALAHRRLVWTGLILARSAAYMLFLTHPQEPRALRVAGETLRWLRGGPPLADPVGDDLFPPVSIGDTTTDEALDVFRSLSLMREPAEARQALRWILDNTLDGSAIFPGSQGKRDLFRWWLLDVLPAAWNERFAEYTFTDAWPAA
jgi:hypothetical protein